MGRKTFDSIGRPLPGRQNLVITRTVPNPGLAAQGVQVCATLDEAILECERLPGVTEAFVIGGGEIYAQALPLIQRLYLTEVHCQIEGDAFFPDWKHLSFQERSRERVEGNPSFSFVLLERSF